MLASMRPTITMRSPTFGLITLSRVSEDDAWTPLHCHNCKCGLDAGDYAQFRGDHWLCECCVRPA